jgi:hypothetical protein
MVFGVILCCIAGLFIVRWAWAMVDRFDSRVWPDVPGTVIASTVKKRWSEDGASFRVTASYRYAVGDREYIGKRIQFGADPWTSRQEDVEDLLWRYARGKEVRVYYAPDHPAEAVLDRSVSHDALFGGIFFLVMGIVCMFLDTGGIEMSIGF